MWPPSMCPTKLTPLKHHKKVGRPKKKRKRSQLEVEAGLTRGGGEAYKKRMHHKMQQMQ
ncbi:hypothetical protein HanIR_Chr06g0282651 [Helianthus annuus]|nr:hypothetical protein HanIR_Chr06g0282651 [Helianthus annuus]